MKIPVSEQDRETLYQDIIGKAFASREDRRALYAILKNYYLFGNGQQQQSADYNKLFSHLDLLSSFLFSGETTTFTIEVSEDVDKQDPEFERAKSKKLVPKLNQTWHDSNLDLVFNDALIWSLVYNTTFVKFVPMGNRKFSVFTIEPHMIGVLREDVIGLDDQEAIVFEYLMSKSEMERRIHGMGQEVRGRIMSAAVWAEKTSSADNLPLTMQKLIINATSPNMVGNVTPQITATWDFGPKITEEVCTCQEVWIWDDDKTDYRCATMIEGQILLFDNEDNPFIKDEQPFVKICPNTVINYFWGRSELMYLIPLQEWLNTRVGEIKAILAKVADPPKSFSGFGGAMEEKAKAFGTPGSYVFNDMPTQAKAELHPPASATDLFVELQMIESMFAEISGIRELMQGKGESGVRATSHADLLVRVGSARVKKKAAILEDGVEKCGGLILKMLQRYDDTMYQTDEGMKFIAKQLSGSCGVKVDSHSSSPIFTEQQLDKAHTLFEAGAIDREDLIDAVKPQNAEYLKAKLKKREAAEAPLAQVKSLVEGAKEDQAPTILNKLKMMFRGKGK